MQIIQLTVKSRNGVTLSTPQAQLIDVDDIAAPLTATGSDSAFTLREGKKGPFSDHNTGTFITPYIVDETLAVIATAAQTVFTANVLTYKGRTLSPAAPLMGFNAKFVAARIIPWLGGSKFSYQEDSDPDLVEYTVSQTPAQILAQITANSTLPAWLLNGNSEGSEKYIGTNDAFDVPVFTDGTEMFRFKATGEIQYPLGASAGYSLISDASGNASWQNTGFGGAAITMLDPVIAQQNTPAVGPTIGDRYLVGSAPTGAWSANANDVAEWDGAVWQFTTPIVGNYVYVTTTLTTLRWNGTAWVVQPGVAILQNGNSFGIAGVRIGTNDANTLWFKTNNILRIYVDGINGSTRFVSDVKIGNLTTAPSARLHVIGSGTDTAQPIMKLEKLSGFPVLFADDSGFVGVRATAPTAFAEIFQVNGVSYFNDAAYFGTMGFISFGAGAGINIIATSTGNVAYTTATGTFNWNAGGVLDVMVLSNSGTLSLPFAQVGDGGLSSGDTYFDTAANILANGDLIMARKV